MGGRRLEGCSTPYIHTTAAAVLIRGDRLHILNLDFMLLCFKSFIHCCLSKQLSARSRLQLHVGISWKKENSKYETLTSAELRSAAAFAPLHALLCSCASSAARSAATWTNTINRSRCEAEVCVSRAPSAFFQCSCARKHIVCRHPDRANRPALRRRQRHVATRDARGTH